MKHIIIKSYRSLIWMPSLLYLSFFLQGCSIIDKVYHEDELLSIADYKRIIPGEYFDPGMLKHCQIVARGVIDEIDMSAIDNRRAKLNLELLKRFNHIKENYINSDMYSKMVYNFLNGMTEYINLSDNFINYKCLNKAMVYIVKITDKPTTYPDVLSWFPVVGEGANYAFFVVSKEGYVLCKHDAEVAFYIKFDTDYLKAINKTGMFLIPTYVVPICVHMKEHFSDIGFSGRSYLECIIGRDAFWLDDLYFTPRCSNKIRIDNGYKPLPAGWLNSKRNIKIRNN